MSETCSKCGKPIVWAINMDTGKRIPLDMIPPIYAIQRETQSSDVIVKRMEKGEFGVSHFATCPDANYFSGRNK